MAFAAPIRTTTTATGSVRVTRRAKHLPPAISRRTNHLEPTVRAAVYGGAASPAGPGVARGNRVATVPHQNSINHRRAGNGTTGSRRRRYGTGAGLTASEARIASPATGGGRPVYSGGHVDNPISVKPNTTSPRSDEEEEEELKQRRRRRKKTKQQQQQQQQYHQRQLQPPANHKWHGDRDGLTVDSAAETAGAAEQRR
uniref:Uncharacterized protein n=1 Tax=Anopheles albimanus TaxID=7167 RepID=A0A182FX43_ANOAL